MLPAVSRGSVEFGMPVHPNSLANLRPPWKPGETGIPGNRYVERMVNGGCRAGPRAIELISRTMRDEEQPISLRLRCAEYIVDKTWPKPPPGGVPGVTINSDGIDFLELRFHYPGDSNPDTDTKPNGHDVVTVSFDPE